MSLSTNTTKLTELKNKANNLPDQNPPAQLQEKTVTPTKEGLSVVPDSGFDGMSKVTVNGDANLVPENIKEGVSIFGVIGSLSSLDVIFYKTVSPTFSGTKETINLTNLQYLPFIIAIVSGSIDTIPTNFLINGNECAVYGALKYPYYNTRYSGMYNDEASGSFNSYSSAKYEKNPDGTYNINNIAVFYWSRSGSHGGNDYTAILIGKSEE